MPVPKWWVAGVTVASEKAQSKIEDRSEPQNKLTALRRIFISDVNPVFADGLALVLRSDDFLSMFQIVSETYEDFTSIPSFKSDILIVDPWQSGGSRQIALDQFIDICERTAVICYASDASAFEVHQLISMGCRGIVPTTVSSEELIRIVSSVAFGGSYVSDLYKESGAFFSASSSALPSTDGLTDREIDVLNRVAMGSSLKEIAADLKISAKTVDTYKTRASRKLNLRTRAEIVRYAIDAGWLL